MSENRDCVEGLPFQVESRALLSILERELDDLERQLGLEISGTSSHLIHIRALAHGESTAFNKILVCCARLQLRTYYFLEPGQSEARKFGIIKAFYTASTLISTLTAEPAVHITRNGPSYVYRMLIVAANVVLKVLHSNYIRYVDFEIGKQLYNSSIALLKHSSIVKNDLTERASAIQAHVWTIHANDSSRCSEEPYLRIRSRSVASVFYDSLWLWREDAEASGQRALNRLGSSDQSSGDFPYIPHTYLYARRFNLPREASQAYI